MNAANGFSSSWYTLHGSCIRIDPEFVALSSVLKLYVEASALILIAQTKYTNWELCSQLVVHSAHHPHPNNWFFAIPTEIAILHIYNLCAVHKMKLANVCERTTLNEHKERERDRERKSQAADWKSRHKNAEWVFWGQFWKLATFDSEFWGSILAQFNEYRITHEV